MRAGPSIGTEINWREDTALPGIPRRDGRTYWAGKFRALILSSHGIANVELLCRQTTRLNPVLPTCRPILTRMSMPKAKASLDRHATLANSGELFLLHHSPLLYRSQPRKPRFFKPPFTPVNYPDPCSGHFFTGGNRGNRGCFEIDLRSLGLLLLEFLTPTLDIGHAPHGHAIAS